MRSYGYGKDKIKTQDPFLREIYEKVTPSFRELRTFEGQEEFKAQIIPAIQKKEPRRMLPSDALTMQCRRKVPVDSLGRVVQRPVIEQSSYLKILNDT